jgi:hypothetical protein
MDHLPARMRNARACHIGLRGVDADTFSAFRGARPVTETVICCDHGADHEQMLRNGTRRVISLEKDVGFHADWSTDDLDRLPELAEFKRFMDAESREAGPENPLLLIPFKNTHRIDGLGGGHVSVLSPPHELVHELDSKMKLLQIMADCGIEPIPGEVVRRAEFGRERFDSLTARYGNKLVAQVAFGSGGSGTFFVSTKEEIDDVFRREGELKISKFIEGPSFNGQACVIETTEGPQTMVFNPSFQIIGLPELSDWPSYYCGNDYTGAVEYLGADGIGQYTDLLKRMGSMMAREGWRGIFGSDLIWSEEEGRMYVLEINPRMQASTSFLHSLMEARGETGIGVYHLLAFLSERPLPADIADYSIAPMSGSHVLVNNRTGSDVVVRGGLEAGMYRFNGSMELLEPHYWGRVGAEDFLVTCGVPRNGTRVQNHGTILKVYSGSPALDWRGKALTEGFRPIVQKVYEALRLE